MQTSIIDEYIAASLLFLFWSNLYLRRYEVSEHAIAYRICHVCRVQTIRIRVYTQV
jgi:hypothetical protein